MSWRSWLDRPTSRRGELTLAVTDQALFSLQSFLVSVLVGHTGGAEALGVFAFSFGFYILAQLIGRSLLLQPMIVEQARTRTDAASDHKKGLLPAACLATAVTGVCSGILLTVSATVLFGGTGTQIAALVSLGMVPMLIEDAFRHAAFAEHKLRRAASLDAIWLAVQLALSASLIGLSWESPATVISAWGLGALVSAALGARWFLKVEQYSSLRNPARSVRKLTGQGRWLAGASLLNRLSHQVVLWTFAVVVSVDLLGGIRAVEQLYMPFAMLIVSVEGITLSETSTRLHGGDRHGVGRIAVTYSACTLGVWALAALVLVAAPLDVLGIVFGEEFTDFSWLLPPLILAATIQSLAVGPATLLRAAQRGRQLFGIELVASCLRVVLVPSLAIAVGPSPAVWAMVLPILIGTASQAREASRELKFARHSSP